MKRIGGHTIDESLLGNGTILDVGCRGFEFADYFDEKRVVCIDPDPTVFNHPSALKHDCWNVAVSDKSGSRKYYRNGEMTCLIEIIRPLDHLIEECASVTMDEVYLQTGTDIDLLKLDCEGSEYLILNENFKPIPKQISVEFHRHIAPEIHDANIDKVLRSLLRCYKLVYQHETGMDNLFIRL